MRKVVDQFFHLLGKEEPFRYGMLLVACDSVEKLRAEVRVLSQRKDQTLAYVDKELWLDVLNSLGWDHRRMQVDWVLQLDVRYVINHRSPSHAILRWTMLVNTEHVL